jgi:hypothetical protein
MVTIGNRSSFTVCKGFALLLASLVFLTPETAGARVRMRKPAGLAQELGAPPQNQSFAPKIPTASEERMKALEERVQSLESEVDELRETQVHSNIKISDFTGNIYLRFGLELVLPQQSSFTQATDSGLGLAFGGGGYLTHDHVIDFGLLWDVHLAASARYRYELHSNRNFFSWGPTAGIRLKVADLRPFDNFLQPTEVVQSVFLLAGAFASCTIPGGQIFFELTYNFNGQKMIVGTTSLHLFL